MGRRGTIKMQLTYELYLVTDELTSIEKMVSIVEQAVKGGVTIVQLREKESAGNAFYEKAKQLKEMLDRYNVPLLINDRIDIALAVGASGVHIGQTDMPLRVVKEIIPPSMVVGVSASTVKEAIKAEADGADYIGVGAIFKTGSKEDAKVLQEGMLSKIIEAVTIPVVAIGGLQENNLDVLRGEGFSGIAVVSAIMQAENPEVAARLLKEKVSSLSNDVSEEF